MTEDQNAPATENFGMENLTGRWTINVDGKCSRWAGLALVGVVMALAASELAPMA